MKKGFSIIELLVVMAIVAALVALAIPAINAMQKSFNSTGTESMISAALATARTLAISNHQYAGVRFQKIYDSAGALKADQYMIFIIFDSEKETGSVGWVCGFVAVEGYKPIKLPENVGVIDKIRRRVHVSKDCDDLIPQDPLVLSDLDDSANPDPNGNNINITDTSTFSILFSPAGKLVSHEIRCGKRRNNNDDVFNTKNNMDAVPPKGMFLQDDFDAYGIGVEISRREFYIYNRSEFEKLTVGSRRWNYLNGPRTERYSVNAYTGEIIK